jgi:RhoGAP domain
VFHKAPLPNKLLLKYLLLFLSHILANVSTNKVDAPALAVAWAPVLFPLSTNPSDTPLTNTKEELRITEIILENYDPIWESGDKKSKSKTSSPTPNLPATNTSPLPTPTRTTSAATLPLPNGDGKDIGKRNFSPVQSRPRANSALSASSTSKIKVIHSILFYLLIFLLIFISFFILL